MKSNLSQLPCKEVSQQLLYGHQHSSSSSGESSNGSQASKRKLSPSCTGSLLALPRQIWNSGLTCAFLASLIFSISALCVKLTGGRIPVLEVCFVRSSLSFLLTIVLMKSTGISPVFGQRSNLGLLSIRGFCGACSMTSYYVGLFLLPLGDAVTIGLIGPSVTAIAARLFHKEPLGHRGMLGCVVSMVGVIVLSKPPFLFGGVEWDRGQALGTVATVLSAFLGAGSSMTIRLIGNREPAAVIAMWFHTCTMILTFIPLAFGIPVKMALMSSKDFSLMLGVAFTSFVAQLLGTRGLQMVMAAKAAAMGFTQVFYSYVMGAIFFGERITTGGLLGVCLILLGVLMATMRSSSCKAGSPANDAQQQLVSVLNDGKVVVSPGATALKAAAVAISKEQATAAAAEASDKLPPSYSEQAGLLSLAADAALDAEDAQTAVDAAVLVKATSSALAVGPQPAHATNSSRTDQSINSAASIPEQASISIVQADVVEAADVARQLAAIAAQAAAALGGELCPATAASVVASRQASFCTALQLSRCASSRIPGSANPMDGPGVLSTRSSMMPSQDTVAVISTAASSAIDIPQPPQVQQGFSRQVSGWLAVNLLATPPADAVVPGSSLMSCSSITGPQEAAAAAAAASIHGVASPVRLTEALLQESALPSPCGQHGLTDLTTLQQGCGEVADDTEAATEAPPDLSTPNDTMQGQYTLKSDSQLLHEQSGELQ